jgi:glycosyltransferase involved in cell wall biosynthesis
MKVALVYDRVNKWGGAERILLALKEIFPDAPLYTSVYNKKNAAWAKVFDVRTSFLQKIPYASSAHEFLATFMPLAFESFNFDEYDLVISLTSEAAKGIITKPQTKHICICLTPTRYLWSGYDEYFRNPVLRFFAQPAVSYLRYWDKIAANRPDKILAISTEVKQRIKKYYNLDSEIINLPVAKLSKSDDQTQAENKQEYFLVVSRLTNFYKRIDLAIKAANKLKFNLKIIGSGRDEKYLRSISGSTIEFLKDINDKQLVNYYKRSKGLIFPGREDFGLVMIEAQSFGKPVLAFRGGGALDIIREGITGDFFDEQTEKALEKAMEKFNNTSYNAKLCTNNALRFSFENFKSKLLEIININ